MSQNERQLNTYFLKNKNFVIAAVSEILINIAIWLLLLTDLQLLQGMISSQFLKSAILLTGGVIPIFFGAYLGSMIDRNSKKKMMLVAGCLNLVGVLFQVLSAILLNIPSLIIGLILGGIGLSIYSTSLQCIIVDIVKPKYIIRANTIFTNIQTVTRIFGSLFAGLLLIVFTMYQLYIISFAIYAFILFIRFLLDFTESNKNETSKEKNRFFEVFGLFVKHPSLIVSNISMTLITFFLGGFNIFVIVFSEIYPEHMTKSLIYSIEGCCSLIGSLVIGYLQNRNLVNINVLLLLGIAASIYLMHFNSELYIVLLGYGLFGLSIGCFLPMYSTIPQIVLPDGIRGRYFSLVGTYNSIVFQGSLILAGGMMDLIGISKYFLILSAIVFINFIILFLMVKKYNINFGMKHSVENRSLN